MTIVAVNAFQDNYIWIMTHEKRQAFSCVDPGIATPVLTHAKDHKLQLENILITHHHSDHAGGIAELLDHYPNACVYGPADPRLPLVNAIVRDEDLVQIDNLSFRVLQTPGHTSSHICYQEPEKAWLFCGDTLFSAGCGRVFDGTMQQLHESILLLRRLPNDTTVYCGHEYTRQNLNFARYVEPHNETILSYQMHLQDNATLCSLPSSIALEKKINPFMRTDHPSILQFAQKHGITAEDSLTLFTLLRTQKDTFTNP